MKFDQLVFEDYLYELKTHLFGDMLLDELIEKVRDNHRARRFVGMYLLKDSDMFNHYLF